MDLVVGTDALLTNGFVNKFDVFCEVRTVMGVKEEIAVWMDGQPQDPQQIASWN